MEITAQNLLKQWQQTADVPNVVFLAGEEPYYRSRLLGRLMEMLFQGVAEEDRQIQKFAGVPDWAAVENAINSYPFFCPRSLVIFDMDKILEVRKNAAVENLAGKTEPLQKLLGAVPDYCTVVLMQTVPDKRTKFYKNLVNMATTALCESVKVSELSMWLRGVAADMGGSFASSGTGQIVNMVGQVDKIPLELLTKEIEKLSLIYGTAKPWGEHEVNEVFSELPGLGAFKLSDAVGKKNLGAVLKYLRIEAKKSRPEPDKLAGGLRYKLKMLILAAEQQRAGRSKAEIVQNMTNLGFNAWMSGNVVNELKNGFSLEKLLWAYQEIGKVNSMKRDEGFSVADFFLRLEDIFLVLLSDNA